MIKYKDTLFRATFKSPKEAIKLYNVIVGGNYDINTPIEVNVLDEMLFTDKENDVSFILEDKLVIFIEHQSTINHNMPLRFIEYLSANYRYIRSKKKYSRELIKLPNPKFYVLYNGNDKWNKECLKLSDAFEVSGKSDTYVELVAKVVNIKPETATIDIKADDELYVYATFVSQVQDALDNGDSIYTALKKAREYCLGLGVSSSLLDKWEWRYGRDDLDMYLEQFSYYEDVRRESYADGFDKGEVKGKFETAVKLVKKGISLDDIADATGIEISMLKTIQNV